MANDKISNVRVNIWINDKEVENNISSIQAAMKKLNNELRQTVRGSEEYNQKLAELKKVKSILQEHQDNLKETENSWSKIKGTANSGLGLIAMGLGAVKGAYESMKTVITSTDVLSDKVEVTLAGWKGGIDAVARAIASMDFKNLGKNIRDAINEGRRYAESLDNIDEKTRALKISEAETSNEILRQTEISKSAKYSKDEQIAAGKKVIKLEEDLTAIRKGIAEQAYQNEATNIATITHLTQNEVLAFAKQETEMLKNIEAGKKYNEMVAERKQLSQISSERMLTAEEGKRLMELAIAIDGASEAIKRYGYAQTHLPGDAKMELFVQKYVEWQQAIGSGLENTMKIRTSTAKKEDQLNDESIKGAKKVAKIKEELEKDAYDYAKEIDEEWLKGKEENRKEDLGKEKKKAEEEKKIEDDAYAYTKEIDDEWLKGKDENRKADLEKEKEAAKERKKIRRDFANAALEVTQIISDTVFDMQSSSSEAALEKELADTELTEKKKAQIRLKYIKQDGRWAAAKIAIGGGIQTAIALMESSGWMDFLRRGIPIAVETEAAIAIVHKAVNDYETSVTRLWTGGYTKKGGKYEPAGVVHAGEWVAPANMVNSPNFGPIIQALESERAYGRSGYANGGGPGIGSNAAGSEGAAPILMGTDPNLTLVLNEMKKLLSVLIQDGVHTRFDYNSVDNIRKGMSKLEDIEDAVTI